MKRTIRMPTAWAVVLGSAVFFSGCYTHFLFAVPDTEDCPGIWIQTIPVPLPPPPGDWEGRHDGGHPDRHPRSFDERHDRDNERHQKHEPDSRHGWTDADRRQDSSAISDSPTRPEPSVDRSSQRSESREQTETRDDGSSERHRRR
jgi:hypothetical protein